MSKEDVDFRTIGFQERFHNFLAFLTGEFTSLGSEDVILACIRGFSHSIFEAFLTADSNGGTNGTFKNNYIVLAATITRGLLFFSHVFVNPFEDVVAFFYGVGTDFSHIEAVISQLHIAVNNNNRDFGIFSFFENRIPTRFYDRNEGDNVNALSDKGTNSFNLIFLFLLSIRELEVDTSFFSCFLNGFRVGRSPFGFRSDLGEAHGNLLVTATRLAVVLGLFTATAAGSYNHHNAC